MSYARHGSDLPPGRVRAAADRSDYCYRMDDEQAAWWTAATASGEDVSASEPRDVGHDRVPGE